MRTLPLVLAALLASSLAGTAHARNPAQETRQREVRIADLDLSTSADVEELHRRITIAAREVCRVSGIRAVWASRIRRCVEESTARALADVARRGTNTTRMLGELK